MSLVNEYLKKTEEGAPDRSREGAVPPILTSSSGGGLSKSAIKWILLAVVAGVVVLIVYQVGPGVRQAFITPATQQQAEQVAKLDINQEKQTDSASKVPAQLRSDDEDMNGSAARKIVVAETDTPVKAEGSASIGGPPESAVVVTASERKASSASTVTAAPRREPASPVVKSPLAAPSYSSVRPEKQPVFKEDREVAAVPDSYSSSPITISSQKINNNHAESDAGLKTVRPDADKKRTQPADLSKKIEQYYKMGLIAQRDGELVQAEKFYQTGLKLAPTHIKMLTNLSAVYIRMGRYDQARQTLTMARQADPGNSKILVNLGNIELSQKRYNSAKTIFKEALVLNPTDETALTNLAYLAQLEANFDEMEDYYRQLLSINPGNVDVLLAYASVLERTKRYAEALSIYEQSLDLDAVKRDRKLTGRIRERSRQVAGLSRVGAESGEP